MGWGQEGWICWRGGGEECAAKDWEGGDGEKEGM